MDFKIGDIFSDANTLKSAADAAAYVETNKKEINVAAMQMMENKLKKYMINSFMLNL